MHVKVTSCGINFQLIKISNYAQFYVQKCYFLTPQNLANFWTLSNLTLAFKALTIKTI